MGLFSSKKIDLPSPPQMYRNPYVNLSASSLYGKSMGLLSDSVSGLPQILQDTVSLSPDITKYALQGLQAQLQPELNRSRQDIINQLEANGQLTSSTTADSLTRLQSDFESRMVAAGSEAAMADIQRALQNRISLYGTGLQGVQGAGQLGLAEQESVNNFNLNNYQNLLAEAFGEQSPAKGGLMGAITGGVGGALAGSTFGPIGSVIGGLVGGTSGAIGPSGTGGNMLTAGAGLYGTGLGANARPGVITNPGTSKKTESIDNLLALPSFYSNSGLLGGGR